MTHPAALVLLEDMFSVLIYTVAERYEEGVGDVALSAIVRREIIHQLLLEPLPYSNLQQRLSHRIVHHPNFDEILTSVATLRFVIFDFSSINPPAWGFFFIY